MKVLGIGNALVDIMVILPDDTFLQKHNLPRGSMQLVDSYISEQILLSVSGLPVRITSGGSAANTINGLAGLGIETGFVGCLGNDKYGNQFLNDFEKNNVNAHIIYSETPSGKAIALISPDGERTFATHLGAAIELNPDKIREDIFSQYNILHIEGYLLQNYDLIEHVVFLAMRKGMQVSLDLASYNVVEQHHEFLKKLIPGNVDILFANEEEAFALTGEQPYQALQMMGEMVPLSVVKIGAKGSMIFDRRKIENIDAISSFCKDTTGAGDLYATGFLFGLITGENLRECGRYGSVLAGHVIRDIGARIADEHWHSINKMLFTDN